ncbi:MAG TPA: hypothetical protein VFZ42_15725 [Chitinophagaceae bacterium]
MKQRSKTILVALLFMIVATTIQAQDSRPEIPKWHSEKGYWVVESNINSPLDHIIRFYNNDNVLMYKEAVTGVRMDPTKRKTKMKLKKVLESSMDTWQLAKVAEENKNYVAAVFKR